MAKRTGKVWTPGTGWVAKKIFEDANYDNLGEGWIFLISFMRWFPDMLQDIMHSEDADYELSLLQRVFMRAKARYQYCDITACRGATKTYSSMNEELDELQLWPGIQTAYFGPNYKQMAKIAGQTYAQIQKDYPGLTNLFVIENNSEAAGTFELRTEFNSRFSISAFRGNNTHKVTAEEYAQDGNGLGGKFDHDDYKQVVLPAVRLTYMVQGKRDPTYIRFKQQTITSAGRRQNHAYETRCNHLQMMERGESAFVMDVPYDVLLLLQMRPVLWAETLHNELAPDEWAREMESRYSGSDENPIVRDEVLSGCRELMLMEEHTCLKDRDCKLSPKDVIYIIGYDVSYADGARNAKCACVVVKCTKQKEFLRRDKYLKQVVWVDDWLPANAMEQAKKLKSVWARYCYEGAETYIAVDAWQYGTSVVQSLMMDLGDGLAPLCIYNHNLYTEFELDNALPVIYPIKAGGVGTTDPDVEMVRNAELQFENHNVLLLTGNYNAGIDAYKKYHRIKDDANDYGIYKPYKKTNELVGQIQNLKKVVLASGTAERRISQHIQRDSWSALKYALRFAQILERTYLVKKPRKSAWDEEFNKYANGRKPMMAVVPMRGAGRVGGKRF